MHIRSISFWSFLALGALSLAACGGDGDGEGGVPACPDAGTELTYDNFGKAFFDSHCTSCHTAGSGQTGADDLPFDSQSAIQAQIEDIYEQAVGGTSMPPGGGPTAEERQQLGEWLSCGAE